MKSENRKYLAADSTAQQLKLNIKAGTTQSPAQTTESFRNLVGNHFNFSRKPTVRKPADLSGISEGQTNSAHPTRTKT